MVYRSLFYLLNDNYILIKVMWFSTAATFIIHICLLVFLHDCTMTHHRPPIEQSVSSQESWQVSSISFHIYKPGSRDWFQIWTSARSAAGSSLSPAKPSSCQCSCEVLLQTGGMWRDAAAVWPLLWTCKVGKLETSSRNSFHTDVIFLLTSWESWI